MLKRLAILAVLAGGVFYPAWPQVPGNGSQQDRPAERETDKPQPAKPAPSAFQGQPSAAKQEEGAKEKPSGYPWDELLAPANIPNWMLCIVGTVAGIAAVLTLNAIKRQANTMDKTAADAKASAETAAVDNAATLAALTRQADTLAIQAAYMESQTEILRNSVAAAQSSADAALKTVQIMIDSERPWVVAHVEQFQESCLLDNGNVRFKWTVKNVGKSPAKLIEAGAMVSLDTMGPPIDKIKYKMESLDERILVPGDSAQFFAFWSIVENGSVRYRLGKAREEFSDLAMFYGRIRYRSAVDTPDVYETRFSESSSITGGICEGFEPSWPVSPDDIRCT